MINEDWKTSQNMFYDEDQDVHFEVRLNPNNFMFAQIPLESSVSNFKETVEADPPRSFDDLAPFKLIEPLDYEINGYTSKIDMPAGANYLPLEQEKLPRPGCENEYCVRGEMGDPEAVKLKPQDQVLTMPESVQKPLDYPGTAVICPHPTIRNYLEYKPSTNQHLTPMVRERPAPMDDLATRATLGNDISSRYNIVSQEQPGNVGIRTIEPVPYEISKLQRERQTLNEGLACDK